MGLIEPVRSKKEFKQSGINLTGIAKMVRMTAF